MTAPAKATEKVQHPGPWGVEFTCGCRVVTHDGESLPISAGLRCSRHDTKPACGGFLTREESAADLLEALRPFAKFACNPPCEGPCNNCRARTAIEKATGAKA